MTINNGEHSMLVIMWWVTPESPPNTATHCELSAVTPSKFATTSHDHHSIKWIILPLKIDQYIFQPFLYILTEFGII